MVCVGVRVSARMCRERIRARGFLILLGKITNAVKSVTLWRAPRHVTVRMYGGEEDSFRSVIITTGREEQKTY